MESAATANRARTKMPSQRTWIRFRLFDGLAGAGQLVPPAPPIDWIPTDQHASGSHIRWQEIYIREREVVYGEAHVRYVLRFGDAAVQFRLLHGQASFGRFWPRGQCLSLGRIQAGFDNGGLGQFGD